MAYNAISQIDEDVVSNTSSSNASESPPQSPTHNAFQPITLDLDNLGGRSFMETARTTEESSGVGRLGSMIRSLTSTSYDMVEDDDYDVVPADPDQEKRSSSRQPEPIPQHDGPSADPQPPRSPSPELEPVVRTPSSGRPPVALRHPTPDLQSLQGAYISNVERLERSAERLSLNSDIGEELRKMDLEQKRRHSVSSAAAQGVDSPARKFSTGSISNSIIGVNNAARNGGYSPGGYVSSPKGSVRSGASAQAGTRLRSTSVGSRLAQVTAPEHEEERNGATPFVPILPPPQPPPQAHIGYSKPVQDSRESESPVGLPPVQDEEFADYDRPMTAASGDTYRQATNLFRDFDGVHFVPHGKGPDLTRRVSLSKPPLASGSEHYKEPPRGEHMVYYPAPVPMMLNLPQRLSKKPPASERERRRTQLLDAVAAENRKSASWLSDEGAADNRRSKRLTANIPPQLRASVFFDQPTSHLDIQLKENSAVATLDSILDASAHAPVTAFTDHPIAGPVGSEVYGSERPRSSSTSLEEKRRKQNSKGILGLRQSTVPSDFRQRRASSGQAQGETELDAAEASTEATRLRRRSTFDALNEDGDNARNGQYTSYHANGARHEADQNAGGVEGNEEEDPAYFGPPTTLLAELQMRKRQQKLRTRTAATAFPNGMHSTLLELDTVAQLQSKARRQRPVTLAWEAPDAHQQDADPDEDVPLGVLFAGKTSMVNESRPLGLMEKRELEENEPLSRRRARLRGDGHVAHGPSPVRRASTMHTLEVPGLAEADSGDEGETLAQRLRRLKAKDRTSTVVGSDFASEVFAQLERKSADAAAESKPAPPEEETLGQRRKRLQEEAKTQQAAGGAAPKARRSMADILQAHPAPSARRPSNGNPQLTGGPMDQQMYGNRMSMYTLPSSLRYQPAGVPQQPGYGMTTPYGYSGMPAYGNAFIGQMGMGTFGYNLPHVRESKMMQSTIDPNQRDVIDRWRQSVR
ncbi:hypothetical protein VTN02DRAFT_4182 [Thermoascus thermophilus]